MNPIAWLGLLTLATLIVFVLIKLLERNPNV